MTREGQSLQLYKKGKEIEMVVIVLGEQAYLSVAGKVYRRVLNERMMEVTCKCVGDDQSS